MKAVMISIQPKWCELICSGKKTVEVRKTKPKLETPFKCYIYCTDKKPSDNEWQYKPNLYLDKVENKVRWIDVEFTRTYNCEYLQQRVIGEFVCDWIESTCGWRLKGHTGFLARRNGREIMLPRLACLSIEEIEKYVGGECNGVYGWHITDLVIYDKPKELSEFEKPTMPTGLKYEDNKIKRPFQSWGYVEEILPPLVEPKGKTITIPKWEYKE